MFFGKWSAVESAHRKWGKTYTNGQSPTDAQHQISEKHTEHRVRMIDCCLTFSFAIGTYINSNWSKWSCDPSARFHIKGI